MTQAEQLLQAATTVLLVDWPTRDVPDTLVRAGYTVVVKGGPQPDHYSAYEVRDGEVLNRRVGRPPQHADLVYSHRPIDEMPGIVAPGPAGRRERDMEPIRPREFGSG